MRNDSRTLPLEVFKGPWPGVQLNYPPTPQFEPKSGVRSIYTIRTLYTPSTGILSSREFGGFGLRDCFF